MGSSTAPTTTSSPPPPTGAEPPEVVSPARVRRPAGRHAPRRVGSLAGGDTCRSGRGVFGTAVVVAAAGGQCEGGHDAEDDGPPAAWEAIQLHGGKLCGRLRVPTTGVASRAMKKLLVAMALGAALAWLFDPDAGSRRRDALRSKLENSGARLGQARRHPHPARPSPTTAPWRPAWRRSREPLSPCRAHRDGERGGLDRRQRHRRSRHDGRQPHRRHRRDGHRPRLQRAGQGDRSGRRRVRSRRDARERLAPCAQALQEAARSPPPGRRRRCGAVLVEERFWRR